MPYVLRTIDRSIEEKNRATNKNMNMQPRFILVPCLLLLLATAAAMASKNNTSGCPDHCGAMSIQYPFGIGSGCFRNGFEITCDHSTNTPFLAGTTRPVPVNLLSITTAEARVMLPVAYQCFVSGETVSDSSYGDVHFNSHDVYRISNAHNQLVVLGCNTLGYTQSQHSEGNGYYPYGYYTGCMSFCNGSRSAMDGACAGVGCCHVDIPPGLTNNNMAFEKYNHTAALGFSPCDYAFLVDRDHYTFHVSDLKMGKDTMMPVWLDWAIREDDLSCDEAKKTKGYACVSTNSGCRDSLNGPGYVCNCSDGYQGNPYIAGGCTDINECELSKDPKYPCQGICENKPGSYECKCPSGTHSANPRNIPCNPNFPLAAKVITGGFGEVYKGYLRDEIRPVAVKKPKFDCKLADQFANEVIIQSRVLHKNIVNLIGCCLEVDVPILVYEYVSNGSLDKILHGRNRMPLDLDLRLQIAAQSAKGLAYMHSEITTPILHGDVKPANILLDEDFVPKISDFGTSRMITIEENYTSTIIGNWGYMDPEYVQTGLYTSKSDVYSFGVVLLELITRKKVLDPDINNLLGNFYDTCTTKKGVIELVDPEISAQGTIGIFHSLAEIIVQCISLDVDLRPEMVDVAQRLQLLLK
ncbi:hypothetical protein HU200_058257 [Digitaria exilis]|uniref:Protein kinase domain-containing protein n=1 Tax=Digitaria exilis TaxID=1010633 RepID=A0A835DZD0_9POAL|nr:hypothetical protein HU200_058257 [Digitaria exilis]